MRTILFIVASVLAVPGWGQERPSGPSDRGTDLKVYDAQIRPVLLKHCQECHGGEKPKGKFRVDQLDPTFSSKGSDERWLAVREQVSTGAMPPKAKPRP